MTKLTSSPLLNWFWYSRIFGKLHGLWNSPFVCGAARPQPTDIKSTSSQIYIEESVK